MINHILFINKINYQFIQILKWNNILKIIIIKIQKYYK